MIGACLALAVLNPVLLIHGIDDTAKVFDAMRPPLVAAGYDVDALDMVPSNGDVSLAVLAGQIGDRVAAIRQRTGAAKVDLVAFSLGGIASRYYLQRLGGVSQVQRFITLSTPHHGTLTGFLRWNPGASELRIGSPFLEDLNRDWDQTARQLQTTTIWTPFDLMIVPTTSSRLPGASEVVVPVALHPWMLRDGRCTQAVLRALQADQSSSESSKSSSR
ncbi:MAG TPA: alpha/beta fold hydrolase [Stenomitos sp.]